MVIESLMKWHATAANRSQLRVRPDDITVAVSGNIRAVIQEMSVDWYNYSSEPYCHQGQGTID